MKKFFLATLWLVLIIPAEAQYWNYNLTWIRGDAGTLRFAHHTDLDSSRLEFFIVNCYADTADTIAHKKNIKAGGDTTQIKSDFINGKTFIKVYLKNTDTKNISNNLLYYDLITAPVNDSTEKRTLYHGRIFLKPEL